MDKNPFTYSGQGQQENLSSSFFHRKVLSPAALPKSLKYIYSANPLVFKRAILSLAEVGQ